MCQGGGVEQPSGEASMGQASTIGLDIAKWVFQAHGADATGRVVFRKRLVRAKVLEFFARQPPCLVALEACGGAHYWARELGKLGHGRRTTPDRLGIGGMSVDKYTFRCSTSPILRLRHQNV